MSVLPTRVYQIDEQEQTERNLGPSEFLWAYFSLPCHLSYLFVNPRMCDCGLHNGHDSIRHFEGDFHSWTSLSRMGGKNQRSKAGTSRQRRDSDSDSDDGESNFDFSQLYFMQPTPITEWIGVGLFSKFDERYVNNPRHSGLGGGHSCILAFLKLKPT